MHLNIILSSLWLAVLAAGQTPPNYPPSTSNHLDIDYNGTRILPGQFLPYSPLTAMQPQIYSSSMLSGSFMLLMLDLSITDQLVGSTPPSQIIPGIEKNHTTLVQWLQGNLTQASNGMFVNSSAPLAPYLAVKPYPAGGIPHTYVFYLFHQPSNFTFPKVDAGRNLDNSTDRLGFSASAIAGVVGPPVAATWMLVQAPKATNSTSTASASSTTNTGGSSTATATSSSGGPHSASSLDYILLLCGVLIAVMN